MDSTAAKFSFRVATYKIPFLLEQRSPNELIYPIGFITTGLWRSLLGNVTFKLSEASEQMGSRSENGSFTGSIGLIQRGKADVTYFPMQLNGMSDKDNMKLSTVCHYYQMAILSFPKLSFITNNILKSFDVFGIETRYLLILLYFILGTAMAIVTHFQMSKNAFAAKQFDVRRFRTTLVKRKKPKPQPYIRHLLEVFRCPLNQADANWFARSVNYLVFYLLLVSFFTIALQVNSMSADSASVDYSDVIDSMDDLNRLEHKTILLVLNTAITEYIRGHRSPVYALIYQRAKMVSYYSFVGKSVDENEVLISFQENAEVLGESQCYKRPHSPIWVSKKLHDSLPLAIYTAEHLARNEMDFLNWRLKLAFEGGMFKKYLSDVSLASKLVLVASPKCNHEKIENLSSGLVNVIPIAFKHFSPLFLLFVALTTTAALIFIIEMGSKRIFGI